MTIQIKYLEIVVVHYRYVRPTVAMLNAFFRFYPDTSITLVDNSGGSCSVEEYILPHLLEHIHQIKALTNPAKKFDWAGPLSHGAGIDLARRQCKRPYLLSMETDTFILNRGGIEYVLSLMEQGYDWAGIAQKPINGTFASFSPCFAIFRVDLLNKYDLFFRRRPRSPKELNNNDLLFLHHKQAADRIRQGLPLEYPEGKPPDTYRRIKELIIKAELQHLEYYDTGEWIHYFLTQKGYRGCLFRSPPSICHTWGSRDEVIFLRNFSEKLPHIDLNEFLPVDLKLNMAHDAVPLDCVRLLDSDNNRPAPHWILTNLCEKVTLEVVEKKLLIKFSIPKGDKVYLKMGRGGFDQPPPKNLAAKIFHGSFYTLECDFKLSGSANSQLWLIEYSYNQRIQHHTYNLTDPHCVLDFITNSKSDGFRILFRLSGTGTLEIADLSLTLNKYLSKKNYSTLSKCASSNSGQEVASAATPSRQNGSYRPGKPFLD